MKKDTLLAGVITASLLSTAVAFADDGKINFIGTITDTACTVVNTVTNPLTVTLGTVSRTALDGAAGKTAAPTDFKIKLTDCPASLNGHTANVKFDGISANSDNTALKLTQDSGVATGVGIQISDNTGAVVPLYTPSSAYNLVTGDNSLDFVARYLAVANSVTAGPANSTSNFTIVYN
ncbi:fimbrial protein [Klebsiella variicola]|uniref:fimbrial protein n=1 Tax=Klebsiella variicola TaxID=244366 RepID=UPI0012DC3FE7|nr:fimbrial protein [Klebsiella variicola]MUM52817.1 fimbrial protein [Klebsiella variicola]MUM58057.1 fimbrial protein [Klebsiella variicola]